MMTRSQTNNQTKTMSRPVTRSQTMERRALLLNERRGWDMNDWNLNEKIASVQQESNAPTPLRRSPRLNKTENIQLTITENKVDDYDSDSDYYPESDDEFDFDESSRAWRQNKTYVGNGMFKYNLRSRSRS
jgi:hypothetical protein